MGTQEGVTSGTFSRFYTITTLFVVWGELFYSVRDVAPWHVSIVAAAPLLRKPLQEAFKAAEVYSEVDEPS